MFSKHSRNVTIGVNETIGSDIQNALWSIIDQEQNDSNVMDYLQVFSLTIIHANGQVYQCIRQKQEQPVRKQKYNVSGIKEPLSGVTVWIIDSGNYCTMLLPDEYRGGSHEKSHYRVGHRCYAARH
jgi:hypothetical protein